MTMKLTDGKRTVEIKMMTWERNHYTWDFSSDFFVAGNLPYDAESEAYIVKDVDYCIEQATDWQNYEGDHYDVDAQEYDAERGYERCVDVDEL
jgi:hypothetical protein